MNNTDICVAEIKSAYGIKGWSWLYSYTDPIVSVFDYAPLFYIKEGKKIPFVVEKWRKQGKGLVVKLENSDDRNTAELFSSTKIWLEKENLPSLSNDEFYWSELISMDVLNQQNEVLGSISQFFETSAHQIMEVIATSESIDDEVRLIPWHKSTVLTVDAVKRVVLVDWAADF